MAPDLNAVAGGERFDYSQPGSTGYSINQDTTYNDPSNRKLRVLTIGAGVTGILARRPPSIYQPRCWIGLSANVRIGRSQMAYRIQKDCPNVEHVIYEKNEDVRQYPAVVAQ